MFPSNLLPELARRGPLPKFLRILSRTSERWQALPQKWTFFPAGPSDNGGKDRNDAAWQGETCVPIIPSRMWLKKCVVISKCAHSAIVFRGISTFRPSLQQPRGHAQRQFSLIPAATHVSSSAVFDIQDFEKSDHTLVGKIAWHTHDLHGIFAVF